MNEADQDAERTPSLPMLLIATGGFAGYSPWASGTVGSLVGLALVMIPGAELPIILGSMILAGLLAGALAAQRVAEAVGHRLTPVASRLKSRFQPETDPHPDPSIVVIDEIVGMWVALLLLPKTVLAYALAFILFRVFDVLKPEPARALERLRGGWGIMLDDVVAGAYANLGAHLLLLIIPSSFGV
jgi:phosphatidylglycerophosphatase A